jgi:dipeptidyl-peptidase-4
MRQCWLLVFLLIVTASTAQQPSADSSKLTLDRIFASGEFHGDSVPAIKWLENGQYTTLEPSKGGAGGNDIVRVDASGKKEVLVSAEKLIPSPAAKPLSIESYEFSKDLDVVLIYTNSKKVWRLNTRGDSWTYHRSTAKLTKHGGDAKPSTLMFAKLSPDAANIGYVCENNLYVEPVDGGAARKLTTDGSEQIINGTFDWVYEEEFFCRDGWRWSPDNTHIAYWQLNTDGVKTFTLTDDTSGKYQTLHTFAYPKTGEKNSACRIGVVSATGGSTTWIPVPGDTSNDYYLPRMEWAGNSQELVIRRVNRLQNKVDVLLADANGSKLRTVLSDQDEAWVDIYDDALEWIDKGNAFSWISERDGWRHLFTAPRNGSLSRSVTSGAYDVIRVLRIDEKNGFVYFSASPEKPTQHYLYRIRLDGNGSPERLSPADQAGWHDYDIAPDAAFAVHTFSSFGKPPRTEMISLPDHRTVRVLATNDKLREKVSKLDQTPVEFFRVDVDSIQLDGWLMKPANFDPSKKYPLFFHVYGEPWGQEVTDRWGGSDYLWHFMLTQQGYAVACIDNRGDACPRGRNWRKSVYKQIGTLASEDQSTAARELLKRPYLDPDRVGVWGWSGGGSMTLNLMFRHPEIYKTGMAVAPVPDMRLYDTIYQERYMGLPQENEAAYRSGSPITHAAGLKGNLLIVHGSGDDNCHYQGTEKLVNKLVEFNKPFTLMAYPNRTHSINEGANTTRHLFGLLTRYLNQNLLVNEKQ